MKNILVIDGAENCVYDIFAIEDNAFDVIFPDGQDIEFIEDLVARIGDKNIWPLLSPAWNNRIKKKDMQGIHGTLFYGLTEKKQYYPTKRDEEACNPERRLIRAK